MEVQPQSEFLLLDYLDGLVEELRKLVATAIRGEDVEAVHRARVATRRLKAATGLVGSIVSGHCRKPFDKITRSLRRQLGPLRDLDVMLGHLDELKDARYEAATAWLKTRLADCRTKVVAGAKDEVSPSQVLAKLGGWWGLRQEISDAREAIDCQLAESIHLQLDAFIEQADQLVLAGKSNGVAAPRRNDPHELRIAGKSLRYTLEMAKEHGKPLPGKVMSLFKKMQESLGIWHDFVVLTERMLCETVECDLALHDPDSQGQILGLAQVTLKKAQVELKKVADLWQTRGQELSREIRDTFPLTNVAGPPTMEPPVEPAPEKTVEPPIEEKSSLATDGAQIPTDITKIEIAF